MWVSTWTCKSLYGYICCRIGIHQWKSDLKDAVKVGDLEGVIDQNTDSDCDIVECEESFCVLYILKTAYS